MDKLIQEGKRLYDAVNTLNYLTVAGEADVWLEKIEETVPKKKVVREIQRIAAAYFKPPLDNVLRRPLTSTYISSLDEKVTFFKQKLLEITAILESL